MFAALTFRESVLRLKARGFNHPRWGHQIVKLSRFPGDGLLGYRAAGARRVSKNHAYRFHRHTFTPRHLQPADRSTRRPGLAITQVS